MQKYKIVIEGQSGLIMHNIFRGLDASHPANIEKTELARKKGSNRTESDDARIRELECLVSLWTTDAGKVGVPERALRAVIENGAKKLRQGPQVREGLIVMDSAFEYDQERYGASEEQLAVSTQFTVPVKIQRNSILRTRAKFDEWKCSFTVDTDEELVDEQQLETWLDIAGRRVGLGDWRPEKSGSYGRFSVLSIESVD